MQLYSHLCNVAYNIIPDKDDCEDIVQETFIAVWDKGRDSLPEKEFSAYMVSAVKNNCISELRKRRIDTVSMDSSRTILADAAIQTDYDTDQEEQLARALNEALATLPQKCREIFLMSKLHGMKYREIAHENGISEKTVENQMGKAIKTLREYAATHPLLLIIIALLSIHLIKILK